MSKLSVTFLLLLTGLLCGCTYGPPEDRVSVRHVAFSPDGARLAVMVEYQRYRRATGLAAFPNGGVPRMLVQRVDLYVLDLDTRLLRLAGSIAAPVNRSVSFSPMLKGWAGNRLYVEIAGCRPSFGDECYGKMVGRTGYVWTRSSGIHEAPIPAGLARLTRIGNASGNLYASTGRNGVSLGRLRGPDLPVLRLVGTHLRIDPGFASGDSVPALESRR